MSRSLGVDVLEGNTLGIWRPLMSTVDYMSE